MQIQWGKGTKWKEASDPESETSSSSKSEIHNGTYGVQDVENENNLEDNKIQLSIVDSESDEINLEEDEVSSCRDEDEVVALYSIFW